jgi:hypothetical protein
LGWNDRIDLLSAGSADPGRFADLVVMLYRDPALWHRLRDNALQRLRADLAPVPEQQKVLRRIQKLAADGLSPRKISADLGARGTKLLHVTVRKIATRAAA